MAKIKEKKPGGDKSQYLGNHTFTTEAGHKFEIDNTPGDRRIHIYHASGTTIEIQDDGAYITKTQGKTQQFYNQDKDEKIMGNFNLVISGDVLVKIGGTYKVEANEIELVSHGDMRFKSGGKHIQEVGGDQRVQVNGKTSHRSSGDREEITGGNKTDSVNGDLKQTIGGENTQIVSGDNATLTGGEHQVVAAGGMGLGAGGDMGIASGSSTSIRANGGSLTAEASTTLETKVGSSGVQVTSGKVRVTKTAHIGTADLSSDAVSGPSPSTKFQ